MDIQTRRIFRLSLTTALSLAVAYGLGLIFAFMAPMFGFMLTFKPAPPMKFKALLVLMVIIAVTTGIGLLLVPLFMHFPIVAVLVVAIGLYLSFYLILVLRQGVLGLFVAMGFTLIAAAALYDFRLGEQLVITLISSVLIATVCQWLVYPWFPALPAMESEAKDVYMASFVRLSLFFFVTLYAWWTVALLDAWRHRRLRRKHRLTEEPA